MEGCRPASDLDSDRDDADGTASTAIGGTTMFSNDNEIWDLGESSERDFRKSSERERESSERVQRKLRELRESSETIALTEPGAFRGNRSPHLHADAQSNRDRYT